MGNEGDSFEDYVAAIFQCYGCYVEKNLHLKEYGDEFLEIDLMITDYPGDSPPKIYIVEVKSGKNWGFPDIFKIRGWMDFIETETHKGFFIVNNPKDKALDQLDKKFHDRIGVRVIGKDSIDKLLQDEFGRKSHCNKTDLEFWSYSHSLERRLLKRLNTLKKSASAYKCYHSLESYYRRIHDKVFFTDNITSRLGELYSSFKENPHISAKCGNEYLNPNPGEFEKDTTRMPKKVYEQTYYDCKFTPIQISTFIEHKARLMILKSAVDYILYNKYKRVEKTKSDCWELIPRNFKKALDKISEDKYLHKYPVFWQWFLWVFGGFIIESAKDKEFELLSEKTGIPVGEIPRALDVYKLLFPLKNGESWFLKVPGYSSEGNISLLKFFSVPFMGLGVLYRARSYSKDWKPEVMKLGISQEEVEQMEKWVNLTKNILPQKKTT